MNRKIDILVFLVLISSAIVIVNEYNEYQENRQALRHHEVSDAIDNLINDQNITVPQAREQADIIHKAVEDGIATYRELGVKNRLDIEEMVHQAENRELRKAVVLRQNAFIAINELKNNPNITVPQAREQADAVHEAVEAGAVDYSELGVGSYCTVEEMVKHVEWGVNMEWVKGN